MSIVRTKRKRNKGYYTFDNSLLQDDRLSFEARGILVYLLSKPEDWTVRIQDLINQSGKKPNGKPISGKEKIQNALKELEACGYARLEHVRDDEGKLKGKSWVVYEDPTEISSCQLPTTGKTDHRENRRSEKPTIGKTAHIVNTDSLQSTDVLKSTECVSAHDFDEFVLKLDEVPTHPAQLITEILQTAPLGHKDKWKREGKIKTDSQLKDQFFKFAEWRTNRLVEEGKEFDLFTMINKWKEVPRGAYAAFYQSWILNMKNQKQNKPHAEEQTVFITTGLNT